MTLRFRNFPIELLFGCLGAILIWTLSVPAVKRDAEKARFVYPPEQLKLFSLGYDEVIADTLWIRVIQDVEKCDQSDRAPGLPPLLREGPVQSSRCNKGWVFHMINAISELAPRFERPLVFGGMLLSVAVDDREGAKIILDKAVERFPTNTWLLFQAAYHYLFEIQDRKRAAELLVKSAENGGPPWLYALAANLHLKEGQAAIAKGILERGAQRARDDEPGAEQVKKRLSEIQKNLQESGEKPAR